MTRDRAWDILEQRRAGIDMPDRVVDMALRTTGDLPTLEELAAEEAKQWKPYE